MNKMDSFMFETKRELGTISQRMADLEGVVEILYHTHQDRLKGDFLLIFYYILLFFVVFWLFMFSFYFSFTYLWY